MRTATACPSAYRVRRRQPAACSCTPQPKRNPDPPTQTQPQTHAQTETRPPPHKHKRKHCPTPPPQIKVNFTSFAAKMLAIVAYNPIALLVYARLGEHADVRGWGWELVLGAGQLGSAAGRGWLCLGCCDGGGRAGRLFWAAGWVGRLCQTAAWGGAPFDMRQSPKA